MPSQPHQSQPDLVSELAQKYNFNKTLMLTDTQVNGMKLKEISFLLGKWDKNVELKHIERMLVETMIFISEHTSG